MSNIRKASDIILSLESKIDILLKTVQAQDLTIKVLSNKLNTVLEKLDKQPTTIVSKPTIESTNTQLPFQSVTDFNTERDVLITPNNQLLTDNSPIGFRRTSRPETFEKNEIKQVSKPMGPPPGRDPGELVIPKNVVKSPPQSMPQPMRVTEEKAPELLNNANRNITNTDFSKISVPVMQRVVDKNGKAIFMAQVEIISNETREITKVKTQGTGKWMATLPVGTYKVLIHKLETLSKQEMKSIQEIKVDGKQSKIELETLIMK